MDNKNLKQQWSEEETRCFVALWCSSQVQEKLNAATRKKPVFEKMQRDMDDAGYTRTVDQLVNKLKKLKKDFRDQKRELERSGSGRAVSPYFEMLNAVLGDRPANTSSGAMFSGTILTPGLENQAEPDVSSVHMECSLPWDATPGPSCRSPERSCSTPVRSTSNPSTSNPSTSNPSTSIPSTPIPSTPIPSPSASTCSSLVSSASAMGKRKRDSMGEILSYMERSDEALRREGVQDREVSKAILGTMTSLDVQGADMVAIMGRIMSHMERQSNK